MRCTKDACENHLCVKCLKCSDCCECEVALDAAPRIAPVVHTHPEPAAEATPPPELTAFDEPPPPTPAPAAE
ncbi:MAG: hypothetical protein ACLQKA_10190 [Bryobacteraceae bacterium]